MTPFPRRTVAAHSPIYPSSGPQWNFEQRRHNPSFPGIAPLDSASAEIPGAGYLAEPPPEGHVW
jgi:hypothetical protein